MYNNLKHANYKEKRENVIKFLKKKKKTVGLNYVLKYG